MRNQIATLHITTANTLPLPSLPIHAIITAIATYHCPYSSVFFAETTDNTRTKYCTLSCGIIANCICIQKRWCADFIALDRVEYKKNVFLWSFLVLLDRHTHIETKNDKRSKPSHSLRVRKFIDYF